MQSEKAHYRLVMGFCNAERWCAQESAAKRRFDECFLRAAKAHPAENPIAAVQDLAQSYPVKALKAFSFP